MSSRAPISASRNFANSVGWVGELVAHLEDVAPVVEPLADDLPRVGDDRREVGGGEVVDDAGLLRVAACASSSPTSRASSSSSASPSTIAACVPSAARIVAHLMVRSCHTANGVGLGPSVSHPHDLIRACSTWLIISTSCGRWPTERLVAQPRRAWSASSDGCAPEELDGPAGARRARSGGHDGRCRRRVGADGAGQASSRRAGWRRCRRSPRRRTTGELSAEQLELGDRSWPTRHRTRNGRAGRRRSTPTELARLARNAVEAVDRGRAGPARGAVAADVVDARQRDAAPPRPAARPDGCDGSRRRSRS